jgi:hypothetical protein
MMIPSFIADLSQVRSERLVEGKERVRVFKAKTSRFIDEVKLKAFNYSYSGLYSTELERSRASMEAERIESKGSGTE